MSTQETSGVLEVARPPGHEKTKALVAGTALGVLADLIAVFGTFTRSGPMTLLIAIAAVATGIVILFLGEWVRHRRIRLSFKAILYLALTALALVAATALVIFFVTNIRPTVAGLADRPTHAGDSVNLTIKASDPDGDALTYSAEGLPDGLSINEDTGQITGTPTVVGNRQVTITAADRWGGSSETTFTWAVENENPRVTMGAQTTHIGASVNVAVSASDPDEDKPLTYTATGLPEGLDIKAETGRITGTPKALGSGQVTIRVADRWVGSGEATFTWAVVNQKPSIEVREQITRAGTPVDLRIDASDPDGDALTYSASGLPDGLEINEETGQITGTPKEGGSFDVTVTVADQWGGSGETRFMWSVPQVTIGYPADNQHVREEETASGTAKGIPAGRTIWLVVKVGNGYYPQTGSLVLPTGKGDWTQSVFFGGPGDAGTPFILYAVDADEAADRMFTAWMDEGDRTRNFPAMTRNYPNPPVLAQVTVVRQ